MTQNPRSVLESRICDFIIHGRGVFEELLLEVHAVQRASCPPYAAFCASQPGVKDWREIPAIPLSAFRQAAIRCFPEDEIVRTFRTSGTTGEGYGQHYFRTVELYHAAALAGWTLAGLPRENVLCLVPHPDDAPHSSLSQMAEWLAPRENFFFGRWDELLAATAKPSLLFGTALAFLDLFEHLGDRKVTLSNGSLAVETGGYKGSRRDMPKADLYRLFEDKLGLAADSIFNEYGMTELSSQFYSHGVGNPHHGAPWVRALVIDPETNREAAEGETGVLRIFDLGNLDSCCAIQTRDLAIRRGDGFELLGRDPSALPRGCSRSADELLSC